MDNRASATTSKPAQPRFHQRTEEWRCHQESGLLPVADWRSGDQARNASCNSNKDRPRAESWR